MVKQIIQDVESVVSPSVAPLVDEHETDLEAVSAEPTSSFFPKLPKITKGKNSRSRTNKIDGDEFNKPIVECDDDADRDSRRTTKHDADDSNNNNNNERWPSTLIGTLSPSLTYFNTRFGPGSGGISKPTNIVHAPRRTFWYTFLLFLIFVTPLSCLVVLVLAFCKVIHYIKLLFLLIPIALWLWAITITPLSYHLRDDRLTVVRVLPMRRRIVWYANIENVEPIARTSIFARAKDQTSEPYLLPQRRKFFFGSNVRRFISSTRDGVLIKLFTGGYVILTPDNVPAFLADLARVGEVPIEQKMMDPTSAISLDGLMDTEQVENWF